MKIIADTHTHTVGSTHAYSTILENAKVASERGLKYLAITDHSPNDVDSPHIWHFTNMKLVVDRVIFGVKMIYGIEVTVTDKFGNVNLDDENLRAQDWVIASIHYPIEGVTDYSEIYTALANNPLIDIIGHPANAFYPYDYDRILPLFKANNKLIEINDSRIVHRGKRADYKTLALKCKEHGVPVIVNSDAHFCNRVGDFEGAISVLEEADFPAELIVNASEETFKNYLKLRGKDLRWLD
jgi:putative hydrolase